MLIFIRLRSFVSGGGNCRSQLITAVFEDGVFKPLDKVDVKEHEKVEIKVLSRDEWQGQLNRAIENIQRKARGRASDEIERDIAEAVKEARQGKRAG